MLQKTLIVLKPDAVKRGIMGEVISRFEKVGLHLVGMKLVTPTVEHFHDHYETIGKLGSRRGEEVLKVNTDFMRAGPVLAMVREGVEAIEVVRKMVGSTEPKSALPGTIRGDYSHLSYGYVDATKGRLTNLIHASATPEEAVQEIALWFSGAELFDHEVDGHLYKRGHHSGETGSR